MNGMKNIIKRILNCPPKVWGMIYLICIPTFALLYWVLPADSFKTLYNTGDNWLYGLFQCLYFSVVTITTLGYGDICPMGILAKLIVICETCFGMIVIGLFLNSVAMFKSKIDLAEEKKKQDLLRKKNEIIKLSRHFLLIEKAIYQYIRLTTVITTPMDKRGGNYSYNPNFKFQDMCDMYLVSGQFRDALLEPAVKGYYVSQKDMADRLESALLNIDFSYWPQVDSKILKILQNIQDYDAENFIVSQFTTYAGGKRMSDYNAQMIKDWTQEVKYVEHSVINPYISLYKLIKDNMPLIIDIMGLMNDIIKKV